MKESKVMQELHKIREKIYTFFTYSLKIILKSQEVGCERHCDRNR
jgi:hypothetical protein